MTQWVTAFVPMAKVIPRIPYIAESTIVEDLTFSPDCWHPASGKISTTYTR